MNQFENVHMESPIIVAFGPLFRRILKTMIRIVMVIASAGRADAKSEIPNIR